MREATFVTISVGDFVCKRVIRPPPPPPKVSVYELRIAIIEIRKASPRKV